MGTSAQTQAQRQTTASGMSAPLLREGLRPVHRKVRRARGLQQHRSVAQGLELRRHGTRLLDWHHLWNTQRHRRENSENAAERDTLREHVDAQLSCKVDFADNARSGSETNLALRIGRSNGIWMVTLSC